MLLAILAEALGNLCSILVTIKDLRDTYKRQTPC